MPRKNRLAWIACMHIRALGVRTVGYTGTPAYHRRWPGSDYRRQLSPGGSAHGRAQGARIPGEAAPQGQPGARAALWICMWQAAAQGQPCARAVLQFGNCHRADDGRGASGPGSPKKGRGRFVKDTAGEEEIVDRYRDYERRQERSRGDGRTVMWSCNANGRAFWCICAAC